MIKVIVYTLEDPRDGLVKYIGVTKNPKKRLWQHLHENENNKKCAWIKKLKSLELVPIFRELDITDECNYHWVERYWICQFKSWGFELKNMTDGGDGTLGSKQSEETKNKIRESNIANNSKPIFCYTIEGKFVKKYRCGIDTNKDGFNSNMVSKVCRGEHKTHKEHIFSFYEINNFKKENYVKKIWNKGVCGVYKHSEEIKKNMSDQRKGKKININNKGNKNPNSKIVLCYDLSLNLIKKYEYMRQVEDDDLSYDIVRKRCKIKNLKPYKGFIFSNDIL